MNKPHPNVAFDFSPLHDMKFGTDVPEMGTGPVSTEAVTSPEYFEKEKDKIFKRTWLEVGRVEEVEGIGDYLTRELKVLGTNIMVVRGKDGALRAFHNMCPHRGMALATDACGSAKGFACEFHGWAFGLDGVLNYVPAEESFTDLDKSKLGLRPLACDTWNGFIFVHWEAEPELGLKESLGGMGEQVDGFPFDRCKHIAHYSATVKANWKVCIDAFQEAYHATYLHRHAIPGASDMGIALPTSVRFYGPHRSVSAWLKMDIQPTAAEAIAYKHGPVGFAKVSDEEFGGANPDNDESWWFDINVFFPNFFCDIGRGWYFTYNFWPNAVNETVWNMNIYQLDAATAGERIVQEFTRIVLRDTVYEDMSTMESSQKAFDSGVIKEQVLGDLEIAVRHGYEVVEAWMNKP
ncbi:MAG: aromatic ring-hydroxylating dioxygenase subunit alpha [Gammaproteobacteria bacterium]|nr:aromatic ring-hydroxylating dioxygenase subunit alpha [Gammaproteobacteria bacterium]